MARNKLPKEFLEKGGPGRPKGSVSGRSRCVQILDEMMSDAGNEQLLKEDLQKLFKQNPAGFYLKFIVPLIPKDVNLDVQGNVNLTFADLVKSINEPKR